MPVLLTTAFDPGDLDPGASYLRAKISEFTLRSTEEMIDIVYEYGNVVSGEWVVGPSSPKMFVTIQNTPAEPDPPGAGTEYDDVVAEVATVGESYVIYAGAKRVLYQWLIDEGHLAGTIE